MPKDRSKRENEKTAALDSAREKSGDHFLTTDQGLRISFTTNLLFVFTKYFPDPFRSKYFQS